jgi:hypothetical protein
MDPDLMKILAGGSGVAILTAVSKFISDWRKGRVMKEDTALARMQRDYDRKCSEAEHAWALVAWYRDGYVKARDRLPITDKHDLPPGPPADLEG